MTKAKGAWRKANVHVRSGQHAKAIYWLSRTIAILDGGQPRRHRRKDVAALFVLILLWVAKG